MVACEYGYFNEKNNIVDLESGVALEVEVDKKNGKILFYFRPSDESKRIFVDSIETSDICNAINRINEKIRSDIIHFGQGYISFKTGYGNISPYKLIEYANDNYTLTIVEKFAIRNGYLYKGYAVIGMNLSEPFKIIVYDEKVDELMSRELSKVMGEVIYNDGRVIVFRYFNDKSLYIIWYNGKAGSRGNLLSVLESDRVRTFIDYIRLKYTIRDVEVKRIEEFTSSSGAIDYKGLVSFKKNTKVFNRVYKYHVSMFGKENEVFYKLEEFELPAFYEFIKTVSSY